MPVPSDLIYSYLVAGLSSNISSENAYVRHSSQTCILDALCQPHLHTNVFINWSINRSNMQPSK